MDQWFSRRLRLKTLILFALVAILFSGTYYYVQFCRGHYEEHFREIILNLD